MTLHSNRRPLLPRFVPLAATALISLTLAGGCASPPTPTSHAAAPPIEAVAEEARDGEAAAPQSSEADAVPIAPASVNADATLSYTMWTDRNVTGKDAVLGAGRDHVEAASSRLDRIAEQRRFRSTSEYVWWKSQLATARLHGEQAAKAVTAASGETGEAWATSRAALDDALQRLDRALLPLTRVQAHSNDSTPGAYVVGDEADAELAAELEQLFTAERRRVRTAWESRRAEFDDVVGQLDEAVETAIDAGHLALPGRPFTRWSDATQEREFTFDDRFALERTAHDHLDGIERRVQTSRDRAEGSGSPADAVIECCERTGELLTLARERADALDDVMRRAPGDSPQDHAATTRKRSEETPDIGLIETEVPALARWDENPARDLSFAQRDAHRRAVESHLDQTKLRLSALRGMTAWPSEHEQRVGRKRLSRLDFLYVEALADLRAANTGGEVVFDERRATLTRTLHDLDDAMERSDEFVASLPPRFRPQATVLAR